AFMNDFYTSWNEKRANELLTFFKLNLEDKINSLSKGNKMKVILLLGLALDADFILMDEPFSGIDVFSREQITKVFTSHLIEDYGLSLKAHYIYDIVHFIIECISGVL